MLIKMIATQQFETGHSSHGWVYVWLRSAMHSTQWTAYIGIVLIFALYSAIKFLFLFMLAGGRRSHPLRRLKSSPSFCSYLFLHTPCLI